MTKGLTKEQYRKYLKSEWWKKRRDGFLWSHGAVCSRCGLSDFASWRVYGEHLNVHHKSYKNLGREPDDDLEVLCPAHHELETFGGTGDHWLLWPSEVIDYNKRVIEQMEKEIDRQDRVADDEE